MLPKVKPPDPTWDDMRDELAVLERELEYHFRSSNGPSFDRRFRAFSALTSLKQVVENLFEDPSHRVRCLKVATAVRKLVEQLGDPPMFQGGRQVPK